MGRRWTLGISLAIAQLCGLVSVPSAAQSVAREAAPAATAGEIDGEARVAVHPGWAEVVLRRRWHNPTGAAHRVDDIVAEPGTGALTGLSVRIAEEGGPWWSQAGRLLGAEAAMSRFRGRGEVDRGRAGLVWRDADSELTRLLLDAIPARGRAEVQLRYVFPTRYLGGRHLFEIPSFAEPMRLLAEAPPAGELTIDGDSAEAVMARDGELPGGELALSPSPNGPLAGEYARVPMAGGRQLVRYHFAIAPELGEAPRAPHVVLILDRSRSRHPTNLERDRARMLDYLDALPTDAKIEVIPFDRQAHPRFGRFVDPSTARRAVEQLSLERRHGSHLDRALALAAERLSEVPRDADRRIVVLTDGRTRHAFSSRTLDLGALAHVVLSGGANHPSPESHPWFDPVAASGGLIWFGGLAVEAGSGVEHPLPAMARLVRPTTLRRVVLHSPGEDEATVEHGDMNAGDGIERFDVTDAPLPWVELEGKIWSRPVRLRLRPSLPAGRRAAALALGQGFELTSTQRRALALHGGALSEHTSFVVAEPGARGAPPALNHGGRSGRLGRSHRARPPRVRSCGVSISVNMDEARAQLRALAEQALARCGAPAVTGRRAGLHVETTKDEIVDLSVTGVSKAVAGCVQSALWDAELPRVFHSIDHERWDEDLSI